MLTSLFLYSLWKKSPRFRKQCKTFTSMAKRGLNPHALVVLTSLFSKALLHR
jgi:hypothetical protein